MPPAPADQLAKVQGLQQRRLKQEYSGRAGKRFSAEVKNSLQFQFIAADLLSAVPVALELIGSSSVAASAADAATIELRNTQEPRLRGCLFQIEAKGREAFMKAGENMTRISNTSRAVTQLIQNIVQSIQSVYQPGMADHLGDFFNSLEEQAKDCSDYSEDVEKLFDTWLMMVAKLHSACEQKLGLASNGNSLSAQISARIQEQGSSHTLQNAKEAAERVKKSLDVAEGNFKQANDAASGPLAAMGVQLVQSAITAGPKLLAAALPVMMAAADPLTAVPSAQEAAILLSGPKVLPRGNDDPGYQAAMAAEPMLTSLYSYLTQGTGSQGIDWGKFQDAASTTVTSNLETLKKTANLTSQLPSQEVAGAIDASLAVLTDIKLANLQANDKTIKNWQSKVKDAGCVVAKLTSTLETGYGAPINIQYMNNYGLQPPSDNSSVDMANRKLAKEQEALKNSQKNYEAAIANQDKAPNDLASIRAKLAESRATADTLKQVKALLARTIDVLVQLKSQFGKLRQFSTAIAAIIEVVRSRISRFDGNIGSLENVDAGPGSLTINNFTQETIYSFTLQVNAYFSLLQDIANIYSKTHNEQILPSINICGQIISSSDNQSTARRMQEQLEQYVDYAAREIAEICQKHQRQTTEELRQSIETFEHGIQTLQDSGLQIDPAVQKAIQAGAAVNTQAVQARFDQYQAARKELATL